MTLEGFIIGMSYAGFFLVAMWALGNLGINNHMKDTKSSSTEKDNHHH
jgi:hypothetical protein